MIAVSELEAAFSARTMPAYVTDRRSDDGDAADALAFRGQAWQDVGPLHWERHHSALFAFTPPAFLYYLPSLLRTDPSLEGSNGLAADALVGILDTSPTPAHWTDFIIDRIAPLTSTELKMVGAWIGFLPTADTFAANSILRALDTLALVATAS